MGPLLACCKVEALGWTVEVAGVLAAGRGARVVDLGLGKSRRLRRVSGAVRHGSPLVAPVGRTGHLLIGTVLSRSLRAALAAACRMLGVGPCASF